MWRGQHSVQRPPYVPVVCGFTKHVPGAGGRMPHDSEPFAHITPSIKARHGINASGWAQAPSQQQQGK